MTEWHDFPLIPIIEPATVYLIGISLTDICFSDTYITTLSHDEQEKAAKFKFDVHRERYIIFHACLRDILSRCLQTKPEALIFELGPHKKPYLKHNSELCFNLSHSENQAIVAITRNADIGVDIEKKKKENMNELAKRFFSEAEFSYLNALPPVSRVDVFYQFWAHKEAFIKATGLGLSQGLKSFTIGLNPSRLLHADNINVNDWTIQNFNWNPAFASAFAVKKTFPNIVYYQYNLP